jgi:hypothetical protein
VRPYLKNKVKRAVGAQVVEHWPRKHEALSSNTPTTKKKKIGEEGRTRSTKNSSPLLDNNCTGTI